MICVVRGTLVSGFSSVLCGIPDVVRFSLMVIGIASLGRIGSRFREVSWNILLLYPRRLYEYSVRFGF